MKSFMTVYRDKLWERIAELARPLGLEVFDIETSTDFLRIFITRAPKEGAANDKASLTVHVSDCARLSKLILNLEDVEDLMPGDAQLEVSSPGINRKLSQSDHFNQAIGERLRLVIRKDSMDADEKEVMLGMLLSFDGSKLEIEEERNKSRQLVDFSKVAEARVDFNFNS